MKYFEFKQKAFAKKSYDDILDYYVNEIKVKDRKLNDVMRLIGELNLEDELTRIKAEQAAEKAHADNEKMYR
jgi:hypothetical protein